LSYSHHRLRRTPHGSLEEVSLVRGASPAFKSNSWRAGFNHPSFSRVRG